LLLSRAFDACLVKSARVLRPEDNAHSSSKSLFISICCHKPLITIRAVVPFRLACTLQMHLEWPTAENRIAFPFRPGSVFISCCSLRLHLVSIRQLHKLSLTACANSLTDVAVPSMTCQVKPIQYPQSMLCNSVVTRIALICFQECWMRFGLDLLFGFGIHRRIGFP
jgi:hypothetical protein